MSFFERGCGSENPGEDPTVRLVNGQLTWLCFFNRRCNEHHGVRGLHLLGSYLRGWGIITIVLSHVFYVLWWTAIN